MNRRRPKKGDVYRHFRGKLYQVLSLAVWTEKGKEMVVFKEADTDEKVYVSLLDQFLSPVDKEKYPDTVQEYRFELVRENLREREKRHDGENQMSPEKMILAFLDLRTNEERIEFLQKYRSDLSDRFLTAASESMEFTENSGTTEERYGALLRFLRTKIKYEGGRLR